MDFLITSVGGAASMIGFALMKGIAGTVVGIVGVSIIGFGILTYLYNPPNRS